MTEIAGRVALVTGGGSGIGRALAMALAADGAAVVVADILKENAAAVVADIERTGGRAIALACDVSERPSVRAMKADANRLLGPISLVFANAGVTLFEPLTKMSDEQIDWVIQVNLFGVMNCLQIFLPDMIAARDGHVMATASYAGLLAPFMTDHAPYVASKAGVIGLMLSMRRELAEFGIGSTVLCPGLVATRIAESSKYRPARFGGPCNEKMTLPSGTNGHEPSNARSPEEVAQMVLAGLRANRAIVMTDASRKQIYQQGVADLALSAFEDAAKFDTAKTT